MSRGELIGLIVGLAVASLAMVHAMIKWTGYLFATSSDPAEAGRRRRWGFVYGALWLVIIARCCSGTAASGGATWGCSLVVLAAWGFVLFQFVRGFRRA